MERGKRQTGRRGDDFIETFRLFKELMQLINSKMQSVKANRLIDHKQEATPDKDHPLQQEATSGDLQGKEASLLPLKLKYCRDWEGLCSQRKEDIIGEYEVCFSYEVMEEEVDADSDSGGSPKPITQSP